MNVQAKIEDVREDDPLVSIDWPSVEGALNETGAAVLGRLLTPKDCHEILFALKAIRLFKSQGPVKREPGM